jgi:UDP-N-acetylmuramoyl-tripeptide--D-alanyl-D-alanine ligase
MAVVGDMLELGQEEVPGHQQVGRYAASRTDLLLCVGERARHTYEAARAAGVAAAWTATRQDALDWLTQRLAPGDTVLLKASRGMQFEWLSRQLAAWGDAQ